MVLPPMASQTDAHQYQFRRFAHSHETESSSKAWQTIDDAAPLKLLLGGRSHVVYADLQPMLGPGFRFHVPDARAMAAVRVSVGPRALNVGFIVVTSRSPRVFKEDFIIPLLEFSARYLGPVLASELNVSQPHDAAATPTSAKAQGRE